jgi:uncharacterized protein (UPF0333 family)
MFKKLIRNKKAQQTAEYALLIALVVAAVIAMQTYAQRAIQARIKGASDYLADETSALGTTNQYEPYYLTSQYTVTRSDATTDIHTNQTIRRELDTIRNRAEGGFQASSYNYQTWGAGAGF